MISLTLFPTKQEKEKKKNTTQMDGCIKWE